jgi:hypothetical protein
MSHDAKFSAITASSLMALYTECPRRVNILGHSIGHSKQKKKKHMFTCVLFRTVSEMELFHCTVPQLLILKELLPTGVYRSNDKVGTVYLVIIHFRKFHRQHQCTLQLV